MAVVGEAAVRVVADGSDFAQSLSGVESQLARRGHSLGQTLGKTFSAGLKVSMASVGALVGTTFVKGFQRLKSIDDAKVKLKGLGHSAKDVQLIMDNALASVKGTSFGLGDAATVAASAVAAGVKPGKDLQRTLKLTADAATIGGTSMSDMGDIFNTVAAKGKVQGDDLAQLTARGIPGMQFLAKQLGVTAGAATEMVSKGKVSFADFQSAMEKGLGGAAKSSGDSFTGAMANVGAAMSRVGADILGGAFAQVPDMFKTVIGWIDKLSGSGKSIGKVLGDAFSRAFAAISKFVESPQGQQFFKDLWQIMKDVGKIIIGAIIPAFSDLWKALGGGDTAGGAFQLLLQGMNWLADHGDATKNIIFGIAAAWVAYTLAMKGLQALDALGGILKEYQGLREAAKSGETMIQTMTRLAKVTKIATAVEWLLNLSLWANPWTWIIIGIILLVAAFVILWKKSEKFRKFWIGLWDAIKIAAKAVADWFVNTLVPFFKGVWNSHRLRGAVAVGQAAGGLGRDRRRVHLGARPVPRHRRGHPGLLGHDRRRRYLAVVLGHRHLEQARRAVHGRRVGHLQLLRQVDRPVLPALRGHREVDLGHGHPAVPQHDHGPVHEARHLDRRSGERGRLVTDRVRPGSDRAVEHLRQARAELDHRPVQAGRVVLPQHLEGCHLGRLRLPQGRVHRCRRAVPPTSTTR